MIRAIRRPKCLAALVVVCFLFLMVFGIGFITESDIFISRTINKVSESGLQITTNLKSRPDLNLNTMDSRQSAIPDDESIKPPDDVKFPPPNYDVHLFYYPWYGSPTVDGKYLHWNHRYLRHWNPKEAQKWPDGQHLPPDDVGSNFYPRLGPYSSRDPVVVDNHMRQIRSTGAGVLAVSWYPVGMADDEGEDLDSVLPMLLDSADKYSLKVCIHIEPYKNRNRVNLRDNIKYIVNRYGNHSAFYRRPHPSGRSLPLYYVYDSYLVPDEEWRAIFLPDGASTVRNTDLDGHFIGLLVEKRHAMSLAESGFDGYYTYFASNGFTYGSNVGNWGFLSRFAKEREILFIPSVGPGYVDERVRPWNSANTKDRQNGKYYERSFEAAIDAVPSLVSITSFNEWHEGTQIEEAVPMATGDFRYLDYTPHDPQYYLLLTRKWVFKLGHRMKLQ